MKPAERNVLAAYESWGHLPGRPFRVLVFMALMATDDEPPLYIGGREQLAPALGRDLPSGTDRQSRATRRATLEAVRSALAQLAAAGAVTRMRPMPGRPVQYALRLGHGWLPSEGAWGHGETRARILRSDPS